MSIRRAFSEQLSPRLAVGELREALGADDLELVVLFVSPDYEVDALEQAIAIEFAGQKVIGCTTAGEITGAGYREGTLTAIGFPASSFRTQVSLIEDIAAFSMVDAGALVHKALDGLGFGLPSARLVPSQTFAMLLVDGLSKQEEALVSGLNRFLDPIPMFGGSAGDGLRFRQTLIFAQGKFHHNAAALTVFHTNCAFQVFKLDHFQPTGRKMVVTEADSLQRLVHEIDAEPAAQAYANMLGLSVGELSPLVFATNPLVVRVGGEYHVRSIQKVEEGGALRFYCGIDEGLVLTLARGGDMAAYLRQHLNQLSRQIGNVDLILGFDCILRRLEAEQRQQVRDVSDVLKQHRVVGFSTYGEQFRSMHVNQTFTGVMIGTQPGWSVEAPAR